MIRDRLAAALRDAMRERDRDAVSVYRTAAAAIANAEATPVDGAPAAGAIESSPAGLGATEVARLDVSEAQARSIVAQEVGELRDAADLLDAQGGDAQRVVVLRRQAELLERVLDER